MDLGILLLRLVVGLSMAAHGSQKAFGWFGGYGPDATGKFMEQLGFHPGRRHALAAGLVEVIGGLLVAIGFLTPLGAALIASVMVVAAVTVHAKNGFFITSGGFEYTLVLGVAALSLAFTGPGTLSVDAVIGNGHVPAGIPWGVAAVVVAVVGAVGQLAQRRAPAAVEATTANASNA